jgi:Ca2+-binding EF-hand superfamily protein
MKYVAVLAALGLGSAVLLVNSDAFAQGRQGGFMERLKAADTNADGMLSRDEAASLPHISKNFDAIDANHDGFITFEELRAYGQAHRGKHRGHAGHGMKALDKDGDGRISREEAAGSPRLAAHFDQVDANHDGFLTRDELKAARRAMHQAHWAKIDTNGDGKVSLDEAKANAPRLAQHFDQVDANHDGFVTPDEMKAAFAGHHGKRGQAQQ